MYKKTIGETLKSARIAKGLSLEEVSFETKIKKFFLEDIEKNDFSKFLANIYAKGLITIYSKFLEINPDHLIQIFKRDFEGEKNSRIIEKDNQEEQEKEADQQKDGIRLFEKLMHQMPSFQFTGRHLVVVVILVGLLFVGGIIYQIINGALSKPMLKIESPLEISAPYLGSLEYTDSVIKLKGKAEPGSQVKVNQLPILLNPDFTFETDTFPVNEEGLIIVVSAENVLGRKNEINLNVKRKFQEITEMATTIEVKNFDVNLTVKEDKIQRFAGIAKVGDKIEFNAKSLLEVSTSNPENLTIKINGKEYPIDSKNMEFENKKYEIIVKVK